MMHPTIAARTQDRIAADTLSADPTWETASIFQCFETSTGDHDFGLAHVHPQAFLFEIEFPGAQLRLLTFQDSQQ